MPRRNYPPEHQADIHFVYGYCNGNSAEAVREYRRRFPNRTVPDNHTFVNVSSHYLFKHFWCCVGISLVIGSDLNEGG